jgi:hypothetical protein
VPLRVAVRPSQPPTVTIGQNSIDPMTGMLQAPLVTMSWQSVGIDVYALIEGHYARIFTVTADVAIPLGMQVSGCSDLTPVLGDVSMAITNVHGSNSEILVEPLTTIEALVPSLLSLAEPALANGLPSFTLPPINGWQLKLLEARGVGQISGTNNYAHVGMYADLVANGMCPAIGPRSFARLNHRGRDTATFEVQSESPMAEYSYRVNGGFWSKWRPAVDGALEVQHPRLVLGGDVQVEIRSRDARKPREVGAGVVTKL